MSVKNFKFVSPGVFINEIDNSFMPKKAEEIGPVVVGRATRGIAMHPIKVESYSQFVEMFGETVPGGAGSDVYREGNLKSPMYGLYAARAFLRANVAPLTYVRLLGQNTTAGAAKGGAAGAGWKTDLNCGTQPASRIGTTYPARTGGAWAIWVAASASQDGTPSSTNVTSLTASLAAVIYTESGAPLLSGSIFGGTHPSNTEAGAWLERDDNATTASIGALLNKSGGLYTMRILTNANDDTVKFNFDDSSEHFIRRKINTNPQLISSGSFYPDAVKKDYWLGESYEQQLRDDGLIGSTVNTVAWVWPLALSGTVARGPQNMASQPSVEANSGWIIGQDTGVYTSFTAENMQKLFRLVGRGHGEWLQKNAKVSIEKIRQSNSSITSYGTFSVVIRSLHDTDNAIQVLERFDNCTLDPASPNFVGKKIGDRYTAWDTTQKRLRTYGEYNNESRYVYVQTNADVDAGATDPELLPFGYFGPPKFKDVAQLAQSEPAATYADITSTDLATSFIGAPSTGMYTAWGTPQTILTCSINADSPVALLTGSGEYARIKMKFPVVRLRRSASAGGTSDPTEAYFGMATTRASGSTISDASIADFHRLLYGGIASDQPSATGVDAYSYIFTLDDVVSGSSTSAGFYYLSGSRRAGTSYGVTSWKDLLDADYNQFTIPLHSGFDGWDITKPDPVYNAGMPDGSTEDTSYAYHTIKRALDTVADPEVVDMNLLTTPGITQTSLTDQMVALCEARADALSLIDLPDVYIPVQESYQSNKADRIGTTPVQAAAALRNRRIDSSYGCTFYPWVQTRDEGTGRMLWIPPSVAMMGVLASSQAKTALWFAPAGFNRGGLTNGAAGIPITNVTERLTSKERDLLYEARINPIASFPSTGIVVFGQKTLQERASALDRINVRRLVVFLKKQISIIASQILFEQNVQATWDRFKSLVEPFLANVMVKYGITDYRLILDETTTTPDLIDQNILYAKIMIKPARAIEFIAIDFVVARTGASFDD